MRRRSINQRGFGAPFRIRRCLQTSYPVLAKVSSGYPKLKGRLPTCYSPVRHSSTSTLVRLACIRHAASVHPEPGSNSQKVIYLSSKLFLVLLNLKKLTLFVFCTSVQFSKIICALYASIVYCPFEHALCYHSISINIVSTTF